MSIGKGKWLIQRNEPRVFKKSSLTILIESCRDAFEVIFSFFTSRELFKMMRISKFFRDFVKERMRFSLVVQFREEKVEKNVSELFENWKEDQINGLTISHNIQLNLFDKKNLREYVKFNNCLINLMKRVSMNLTKFNYSCFSFSIIYNQYVRKRIKKSEKQQEEHIVNKDIIIERLKDCLFRKTVVNECPNLQHIRYPVIFSLISIEPETSKKYKSISFNLWKSSRYIDDVFEDIYPQKSIYERDKMNDLKRVSWKLVSDFFSHQTLLEELSITDLKTSETTVQFFKSINLHCESLKFLDFDFSHAINNSPDLIQLFCKVPLVKLDMHIGEISFPFFYLLQYSQFKNLISDSLLKTPNSGLKTLYINMYEHTESNFNKFLQVEGLTLVINFMGVNVTKKFFDFSKLEYEKVRLKRLVLRKRGFSTSYKKEEFSNFSNLRMSEIELRYLAKKKFNESGFGDMIIHNPHFENVYIVFETKKEKKRHNYTFIGILNLEQSKRFFVEMVRILKNKKKKLKGIHVSGVGVSVGESNFKDFEELINTSIRLGVDMTGCLPEGWKITIK